MAAYAEFSRHLEICRSPIPAFAPIADALGYVGRRDKAAIQATRNAENLHPHRVSLQSSDEPSQTSRLWPARPVDTDGFKLVSYQRDVLGLSKVDPNEVERAPFKI